MSARVLLSCAVGSLLSGCAVYLLARPEAPALFNLWLAPLVAGAGGVTAISLPFADQLPSFFHMLAMLLATLAVTVHNQPVRYIALLITTTIGLAMEFVQHPAVIDTVLVCSTRLPCSGIPGLKQYAEHGTFDLLDVLAILVATIIVCLWTLLHDRRIQYSNNKELAS